MYSEKEVNKITQVVEKHMNQGLEQAQKIANENMEIIQKLKPFLNESMDRNDFLYITDILMKYSEAVIEHKLDYEYQKIQGRYDVENVIEQEHIPRHLFDIIINSYKRIEKEKIMSLNLKPHHQKIITDGIVSRIEQERLEEESERIKRNNNDRATEFHKRNEKIQREIEKNVIAAERKRIKDSMCKSCGTIPDLFGRCKCS